MRTKDFENEIVPAIKKAIESGETQPELQLVFHTQLLIGILMALNDLLATVTHPHKQHLNVYTLPIVD